MREENFVGDVREAASRMVDVLEQTGEDFAQGEENGRLIIISLDPELSGLILGAVRIALIAQGRLNDERKKHGRN